MCRRTSVERIEKANRRTKRGAKGEVLRESTRGLRDKARCKRASVEGINKTNQRITRGVNGQILRRSTRQCRE